jgi:GMP synthase (glutamine-hydrolysing)
MMVKVKEAATRARTHIVVGPRAVALTDGMTAGFYQFDRSFPGTMATCITSEVKGINWVVYDATSKPPGTIEWE